MSIDNLHRSRPMENLSNREGAVNPGTLRDGDRESVAKDHAHEI
jgi:hypothetical protein